MPDTLSIGTRVRSYDFPRNYDCYVEGEVVGYGGDVFPSDSHYRVKVGKRVWLGQQRSVTPDEEVYPPIPKVFGHQLIYPIYGQMPVKPITKDRFHEMLEILPPQRWYRGEQMEWFHMSERLSGDYVSWFARVGGNYYEFQDLYTLEKSAIARILCEGDKLHSI